MFSEIKRQATTNLQEIKGYLDEVDKLIPALPAQPTDFHNTLKGMYFVYTYGVYEAVVTKTVRKTLEELNKSGKPLSDYKIDLLAIILNDEYDSLYGAGRKTKWKKRWDIGDRLRANEKVKINTELIPTDGQNYRYAQLESIVKSFGVPHDILPRAEIGGYIEEMVKNRNHIAHGDEIPKEVGKRYTVLELSKHLKIVDEFCTYFIDMFENYINSFEFLKSG